MEEEKYTLLADLQRQVRYHNHQYYNLNNAEISDHQYDQLFKQLKQLEDDANLEEAAKLTATVGHQPVSDLDKVGHTKPMLSLDNAFSDDDMADFDGVVGKEVGGTATATGQTEDLGAAPAGGKVDGAVEVEKGAGSEPPPPANYV